MRNSICLNMTSRSEDLNVMSRGVIGVREVRLAAMRNGEGPM